MSQQYCWNCKAPVEPDHVFCGCCGAKLHDVLHSQQVVSDDSSPVSDELEQHLPQIEDEFARPHSSESAYTSGKNELSQSRRSVPRRPPVMTPDQPTQFMPAVMAGEQDAFPQVTHREMLTSYAPAKRRGIPQGVLGAIIAVLALVIIGLLIALFVMPALFPQHPEDTSIRREPIEETTPAPEEPSKTMQSTDPQTENKPAESKDYFSDLTAVYASITSFDQRINEAATQFNASYLDGDKSVRISGQKTAQLIAEDIKATQAQLKDLSIDSSSPYAAQANELEQLLEDLAGRIGSINEAWALSVSFDHPQDHEEEILAPIARDREGSSNKYKADFEERYPQARPTQQLTE